MTRDIWFESFYSPGDPNRIQEDGIITDAYPFFGVVDGFSEPFSPSHTKRIFNLRQTGGQLVRDIIIHSIERASPALPLKETIRLVNADVLNDKEAASLHPTQDDFFSGASFLIGKINPGGNVVEIAQGGDCVAVVLLRSGDIRVIWGEKFQPVEINLRRRIAEIMTMPEVAGNRGKMWDMFYPYLCKSRKERGNKEYPILDGRPELMNLVEITTLPLSDLQMITCFTDGLVPWDEDPDWEIILTFQSKDGFRSVMEWTRSQEKAREKESHETFAEASCQVVHFE